MANYFYVNDGADAGGDGSTRLLTSGDNTHAYQTLEDWMVDNATITDETFIRVSGSAQPYFALDGITSNTGNWRTHICADKDEDDSGDGGDISRSVTTGWYDGQLAIDVAYVYFNGGGGNSPGIRLSEDYVSLEGLQFHGNTSNSYKDVEVLVASHIIIDGCRFAHPSGSSHELVSVASSTNHTDVLITNCIFNTSKAGAYGVIIGNSSATATIKFYNNAVFGFNNSYALEWSGDYSSVTYLVKNNVFFDNGGNDIDTAPTSATWTAEYNAYDNETASETGDVQLTATVTDDMEDPNNATEISRNVYPISSGGLVSAGIGSSTDSNVPTYDILGNLRSTTAPTIGPFEFPAATGITTSPTTGALALAGLQPSAPVAERETVSPTTGALALAGDEPTLSVAKATSPATGALALAGLQPSASIAERDTVSPTTGALALAGLQSSASIAERDTVSPTTGALVLAGLTPSAPVAERDTVSPTTGALALTGLQPSVLSAGTIVPTTGALALAGLQPSASIAERDTVSPTTGALALAGLQPSASIAERDTVSPTTGALALTGLQPSASIAERDTVSPTTGALVLAGLQPTPSVTGASELLSSPGTGTVVFTGAQPIVSQVVRDTVTPDEGTLSVVGDEPTPSLALRETVSPGADVLTILGLQASLTISATLYASPDEGTLALSAQQPTTTVVLRITALPGAAGLTIVGEVPTVPASGVVSAITGELTLVGGAPQAIDSSVGVLLASTVQVVTPKTVLMQVSDATQLLRIDTSTQLSVGRTHEVLR